MNDTLELFHLLQRDGGRLNYCESLSGQTDKEPFMSQEAYLSPDICGARAIQSPAALQMSGATSAPPRPLKTKAEQEIRAQRITFKNTQS